MRLAILSAMILPLAAGGALAQRMPPTQPQPPADTSPAIPQAPIGHRQPTIRDLPPGTARQEESDKGSAASDFGPLPNICQGC